MESAACCCKSWTLLLDVLNLTRSFLQFHNKWAHSIVTSGWGASVRIRLYVRKLHKRDPTESEYEEIAQSGEYKSITEDEVKNAYFSGQEVSLTSKNSLFMILV